MILARNIDGNLSLAVMDSIESWDSDVVQIIREGEVNAVDILVSSGGGDVSTALAVRSALSELVDKGVPVEFHARGIVASAACALCAISGAKVVAHVGSRFMMHPVSGVAVGNADEVEKTVNAMRAYDEALKDIYASKITGISREELDAMYDAETWIDPNRGKEIGLVDELAEDFVKDEEEKKKKDEQLEAKRQEQFEKEMHERLVKARNEYMRNAAEAVISARVEKLENVISARVEKLENAMSASVKSVSDLITQQGEKLDNVSESVANSAKNTNDSLHVLSVSVGDMSANLGISDIFNRRDEQSHKSEPFKPTLKY